MFKDILELQLKGRIQLLPFQCTKIKTQFQKYIGKQINSLNMTKIIKLDQRIKYKKRT